jgi:hypothetical protein
MNPSLAVPSIVDVDPDDLVLADQTPSVGGVGEAVLEVGTPVAGAAGGAHREVPTEAVRAENQHDSSLRDSSQGKDAKKLGERTDADSTPIADHLSDDVAPSDYVADYDDDQSAGFDDDGVDQRVPFT